MNLQYRIDLLVRLGEYILSDDTDWLDIKERASRENGWFIPQFTELACSGIAHAFLQKDILTNWTATYQLPEENKSPRKIGIVMAGNIPLVGFHDLLCVFITGNTALVKLSTKDALLSKHLVEKMTEWNSNISSLISFADMLKGCDAYIATGSNNSAGYFDYYFGKYPHIIRRNRTSAAILTGNESEAELEALADDVYSYFGRGCRNVTKLYTPDGYDFVPLLNAFRKYNYLADHHKYKNNYDYTLAIHLLNKAFYMSNESLLLVENSAFYAPISQLNYENYTDVNAVISSLKEHPELQCLVGQGFIPFGQAQIPAISDYADGVDTLAFLTGLSK